MRLFILAAIIILLASCTDSKEKPDVSNIKVNVKVERFDEDFFSLDTNDLSGSMDRLYKKYPSFMPVYFEFFSPVNFMVQQQGKSYKQAVTEYYRDIKPLANSVQKRFPGVNNIQKGLDKYLRYVKYYYPSFKLPAVLTSVESLNPENKDEIYGTLYFRDTLVISLQMFLGKNFKVYDPTQYFDYLRRRFEPQYIVPNSIRAIANTIYTDSSDNASLVEQMIEKGKQWYLLDHFLPDMPDSMKTYFTGDQLKWCKKNEGNIWGSILTNTPDLYTVDQERIQNYLGEAPFTPDMPHDMQGNGAPGNIGQWVGWQIVKKFAGQKPNFKLQEVLATPAKKIFMEAEYKPK